MCEWWIRLFLVGVVLACLRSADADAKSPRLYSRAAYQSPVRGDPDDLLLLAGDALSTDVVAVYQAYSSSEIPRHPQKVPSDSSALSGVAPIVSASGAPYQLVVHLPANMLPHQRYRIWVKSPLDEWSNGVSINDTRPLWFSPSSAYATTQMGNLPRYIKVVGRNMQASGRRPAVRLVGRKSYELRTALDDSDNPILQSYVVQRRLPKLLEPGEYRIELESGEANWASVPDQIFTVFADPLRANEFNVSDAAYGKCRADDGQDDTDCAGRAIEAARRSGGGTVVFERGTWNLRPGVLVVPPNVELRGRGYANTRIVRLRESETVASTAEIVLLGHNTVSGITFADEATSGPHSDPRPILQIGRRYNTDAQPQAAPTVVSDVVISGNVFDKTDGAVVDGGNPIERLYIAYNQFGDYRLGLNLGGNRYNVRSRFGIADAVISHNQFMPGSYLDLELGQGAIASEVGASKRMDFSSNLADGASRRFLYSSNDPPGWRAAFFWHMNDSHEGLLISDNNITCSGDKDGDGEAIALDSNANTFGLSKSQRVSRASSDTVSVMAPLIASQNNRSVDVDSYYIGHWLRVDAGPGIGQSRRIIASRRGGGEPSDATTLRVEPSWDVPPEADVSTVSVAREYWQAMIIGNTVDQRKPLCLKGNRTRPRGGNISVWGQSADTVVEGNHQFDTDGIIFEQRYGANETGCAECKTMTAMPAFLEIRNNLIDGEYDWASACSLSGIMGSYSASPSQHSPPPLLSFGVTVSHNRIRHADSLHGGAISIVPTWFSGPQGYARPLVEGLSIHHNVIENVSGSAPQAACSYAQDGRYGIYLQGEKYVDGTVLFRNVCEDVTIPLRDHGLHTKRLCDSRDENSCECSSGK